MPKHLLYRYYTVVLIENIKIILDHSKVFIAKHIFKHNACIHVGSSVGLHVPSEV